MVMEEGMPEMEAPSFDVKGGPPPGWKIPILRREDRVPERRYGFQTPPAPIPANEIKESIDTEVLVVGAGISGISAALSAAEAGARVLVIEKTKTYHGFGGEVAAIDSRLQKKLGAIIDKDEVILNLMKYAANRPDQRLIRMWAFGSGSTLDWLLDMAEPAGIKVKLDQFPPPAAFNNSNEYYPQYSTAHEFGSVRLVMKCMIDHAFNKGTIIRYNTRAKQLLRKGKGRVTGVIAQDANGNYIQFNAKKAVVLCTGDYAHNSEMVAKYCPEVEELQTSRTMATGDGHEMAMWIGAEMEPAPHAPMIHPSFAPLGNNPFLQVNIRGERFQNEDVPCEHYCTAISRQPGKMAWQVFDAKYPEELQYMGIGHMKEWNRPADKTREWVDNTAVKADTIEELAQKIGVPVETFKATITRYNELAKIGRDLDFSKRADRITPINQPPYYAGKTDITFFCIVSGLNNNPDLQPLDNDYNAIPGLYLAGNIAGNRYGVMYPSMCPGISNGMCVHFGRIAGLNAANLEH